MWKTKIKGAAGIMLATIFMMLAGLSHAQYLGPGEMPADTTVAQVLAKPIDGQQVLLKGRITQRFGKKYYEFRDNTGSIRAKISEKLFYNRTITANTTVEIFGEVDKRLVESPFIKVFRLTVAAS